MNIEIAKPERKATPRNGFVTDLAARGTRWKKVENETFNVLTIHGYNLEHNSAHG